MARPLPKTPDQWLKEILLAWKDATETKPFVRLTGTKLTDAELFHLAPLVCLKFRGRKLTGKEADKVREGALVNYVVNSGPEAPVQGLESKPQMAARAAWQTDGIPLLRPCNVVTTSLPDRTRHIDTDTPLPHRLPVAGRAFLDTKGL